MRPCPMRPGAGCGPRTRICSPSCCQSSGPTKGSGRRGCGTRLRGSTAAPAADPAGGTYLDSLPRCRPRSRPGHVSSPRSAVHRTASAGAEAPMKKACRQFPKVSLESPGLDVQAAGEAGEIPIGRPCPCVGGDRRRRAKPTVQIGDGTPWTASGPPGSNPTGSPATPPTPWNGRQHAKPTAAPCRRSVATPARQMTVK